MQGDEDEIWLHPDVIRDLVRYLMQLDAKLDEIRRLMEGDDGEEEGLDA